MPIVNRKYVPGDFSGTSRRGGRGFGGGRIIRSNGFTDDPLFMHELKQGLLSRLNSRAPIRESGPAPVIYGGSITQPTAQDRMAKVAEREHNAKYGRYGRGGLERERLAADIGIKREGFRSAESIAGTQAGAQTGVADIRARAARDVTGMEQERQRQQDIMRFHPGDAFTPQGLESRNLDILKQKNELDAQQQKMPKVFQQEGYDDRGVATNTYQMPVLDPETGQYVMQTLPQRQSGLGAAGNQGVASQGLKGIAQTAFKSPDEVANSNLSRAEKLKILREQFGME